MENEFTPDLYELEDEMGNKQTFEMLDAMDFEGERYYALTPYFDDAEEALEDSGEVVILKSEFDEASGEEVMASIEDDEVYEKIGNLFMERIEAMFEFDEEDECDCDDENCQHHNMTDLPQ